MFCLLDVIVAMIGQMRKKSMKNDPTIGREIHEAFKCKPTETPLCIDVQSFVTATNPW